MNRLSIDWPTLIVAEVMIALALAAWATAAYRIWSGAPVVPFENRREVPWRITDLLMIALFFWLATFAFYAICLVIDACSSGQLFRSFGHNPMAAGELIVTTSLSVATSLATIGFASLWIFAHTGASWNDFGLRWDTVRRDVRLGLWAFCAIAAPIYGLQAALSPLTEEQHPIIEVLTRERTPLLYLLTGLSAVVVAPLAEEFLFRVLLQGWLEAVTVRATLPEEQAPEPLLAYSGGLAIFASSLVFALLHVGHGTAPIPLFFLALMLGFLYRRTHRLLPSVTVHFCLNACSFLMLCLTTPNGS